jgi:hypothetical protein
MNFLKGNKMMKNVYISKGNENLVVHISKEDYENLIELLEIANEFFKKEGETLLIIECQDIIEKLKRFEE